MRARTKTDCIALAAVLALPLGGCGGDDNAKTGDEGHLDERDRQINPAWAVEDVGTDEAYDASAVVDGKNAIHVFYARFLSESDLTPESVTYGHQGADGWAFTDIDPEVGLGNVAVDSSGAPHVAWATLAGEVKYAALSGEKWSVETVDLGRDVIASYVAVAVDGSGEPHLGVVTNIDEDLLYVSRDAGKWAAEPVDTEPLVGGPVRLAFDGAGAPHLVYTVSGADEQLVHASRGATEWSIETIAPIEHTEGAVSTMNRVELTVADDLVHVLYDDSISKELRLATLSGSSWEIGTVAPDASGGAIAVAGGKLHVAYVSSDGVTYATFAGDRWDPQAIDSDAGGSTALVVDGDGKPQVLYTSDATLLLRHASPK